MHAHAQHVESVNFVIVIAYLRYDDRVTVNLYRFVTFAEYLNQAACLRKSLYNTRVGIVIVF